MQRTKKKRTYRMAERAKAQDETRTRIVEAAVHLHEKLGPASTPISAIAERAGVQRLTVYRHFPDDAALFAACTSHWGALHPPPDAALWQRIADPTARFAAAVAAHYAYFSGTKGMWTVAYRDRGQVPAIQPVLAGFDDHLDAVAQSLAAAFDAKGAAARRLAMTAGHALAFATWSDLDRRGLSDAEKTRLACAWLEGAHSFSRSPTGRGAGRAKPGARIGAPPR